MIPEKDLSYSDILTFLIPTLVIVILPGPTYIAGFLLIYVISLYYLYKNLSLALFQVFLFSLIVGKEFFTLPGVALQNTVYFQVPYLFSIPTIIPLRFLVFIFFTLSLINVGSVKNGKAGDYPLLVILSFVMLTLVVLGQIFGNYNVRFKFPYLQMLEIFLVFPVVYRFLLLNSAVKDLAAKIKNLFMGFSFFILITQGVIAIIQFIIKTPIGLNIEGVFDAKFVMAPETGLFRSPGTLNHPNYLATVCGMLLPVPIYYLIKNKKTKLRNESLLSIIFGSIALFLSFSRWAWISFLLGFILIIYSEKKYILHILRKKIRLGMWIFAILTILTFVTSGVVLRFTKVTTLKGRIEIVRVAMMQITKNPLWGVGPGNSTVTLPSYHANLADYNSSLKGVHNTLIMLAVENGIPLAVLFGLFIAYIIYKMVIYRKFITKDHFSGVALCLIIFILNSGAYSLLYWDPSLEIFFIAAALFVFKLGSETNTLN